MAQEAAEAVAKSLPDPIDKSLKTRVIDGKFSHTQTVKDPNAAETDTFKLKLKGGQPVLKEAAVDPEELKAAAFKPAPTDTKEQKESDSIDQSLQARLKEGSVTSIIRSADFLDEPDVFPLKQVGEQLQGQDDD